MYITISIVFYLLINISPSIVNECYREKINCKAYIRGHQSLEIFFYFQLIN